MNFYGCFPCATYEIKSNKIEGVFPSVVCVYPFFYFSRAAERWKVENRSEIVFRSYSIYGWCSFCGRKRTEKLKLKIPSEATDRERAENVGWEENCAKKIDSKSIWMVLSLLLLCSAFNFFLEKRRRKSLTRLSNARHIHFTCRFCLFYIYLSFPFSNSFTERLKTTWHCCGNWGLKTFSIVRRMSEEMKLKLLKD